ncbi:MAG: HEPN domain-containing protein [Phycisphaerales bacterium]|nr:MAG: HEPN domain-containing protein [Phycisphaerales bacterium]
MADRSKDWLAQARRDLNHSVNSCKSGDFEWSCFSAQQGAEKAVKAVFLYLHGEGWGHSVYGLLKAIGDKVTVSPNLLESAKILDKHYIPTRYPNGFDSGIPGDYYTENEAQEAIRNAGEIIRFCEGRICGQK